MKAEPLDAETASALLRRFEPVVRFTKGERFYPMDVEPYVRACSLWVQHPGEEAVRVVKDGELTLDRIAQQPDDEFGAAHFLKLTDPRSDGQAGPPRPRRAAARRRVWGGALSKVHRPPQRWEVRLPPLAVGSAPKARRRRGTPRDLPCRTGSAGASWVRSAYRGCPLLAHPPGSGASARPGRDSSTGHLRTYHGRTRALPIPRPGGPPERLARLAPRGGI